MNVSNRLTLASALLYKWYEEKAEIEHLCLSDHLKAGIKCVSEFIICTYRRNIGNELSRSTGFLCGKYVSYGASSSVDIVNGLPRLILMP